MGIEQLKGHIIVAIDGGQPGDEEIIFRTHSGHSFKMYHDQDCCEYVRLCEVIGDINDLLESEVLQAQEATNSEDRNGDSATWTFYHIATMKGHVTLRWLGESNGYYSERVSFEEL